MSVKAKDIIIYAYREIYSSRTEEFPGSEFQVGLIYLDEIMARWFKWQ